eukprot:Colp12_sorted_trinity150504_noHs@6246
MSGNSSEESSLQELGRKIVNGEYKPTPSEERALQECTRLTSIYAVVFGSFGGFGTYYMLGRKPHNPLIRRMLSMSFGVFGMYIGLGLASARCMSKLIKLEDSPIADQLRARNPLSKNKPSKMSTADRYDQTVSSDVSSDFPNEPTFEATEEVLLEPKSQGSGRVNKFGDPVD